MNGENVLVFADGLVALELWDVDVLCDADLNARLEEIVDDLTGNDKLSLRDQCLIAHR